MGTYAVTSVAVNYDSGQMTHYLRILKALSKDEAVGKEIRRMQKLKPGLHYSILAASIHEVDEED